MVKKILALFLNLSLSRRKALLFFTVAITIISIGLSSRLTLDMKWTTLLPASNPVVQEYLRVTEDYPMGTNYFITVKGDDSAKIEQAVDIISKEIESHKDIVTTTYGKMDEAFIIKHGLRIIKPKDLKRAGKQFSDLRLTKYLTHLNDDFEKEFSGNADEVKNQEKSLVILSCI